MHPMPIQAATLATAPSTRGGKADEDRQRYKRIPACSREHLRRGAHLADERG